MSLWCAYSGIMDHYRSSTHMNIHRKEYLPHKAELVLPRASRSKQDFSTLVDTRFPTRAKGQVTSMQDKIKHAMIAPRPSYHRDKQPHMRAPHRFLLVHQAFADERKAYINIQTSAANGTRKILDRAEARDKFEKERETTGSCDNHDSPKYIQILIYRTMLVLKSGQESESKNSSCWGVYRVI